MRLLTTLRDLLFGHPSWLCLLLGAAIGSTTVVGYCLSHEEHEIDQLTKELAIERRARASADLQVEQLGRVALARGVEIDRLRRQMIARRVSWWRDLVEPAADDQIPRQKLEIPAQSGP